MNKGAWGVTMVFPRDCHAVYHVRPGLVKGGNPTESHGNCHGKLARHTKRHGDALPWPTLH